MGDNTPKQAASWTLPSSPYMPIDCNFHDRLLAWATLKTTCDIVLRSTSEKTIFIQGIIQDVFTKDKQESAVLQNSFTFRLDQIISINGILRPSEGACDIKE